MSLSGSRKREVASRMREVTGGGGISGWGFFQLDKGMVATWGRNFSKMLVAHPQELRGLAKQSRNCRRIKEPNNMPKKENPRVIGNKGEKRKKGMFNQMQMFCEKANQLT